MREFNTVESTAQVKIIYGPYMDHIWNPHRGRNLVVVKFRTGRISL